MPAFMDRFIHHYNHEHLHTGIGLHPPTSTTDCRSEKPPASRDSGHARAAHPTRFGGPTGMPKPPDPNRGLDQPTPQDTEADRNPQPPN